ncbi:MAG: hypothetical protein ACXVDN_11385 [Ktedonobacteraceae bacterium]
MNGPIIGEQKCLHDNGREMLGRQLPRIDRRFAHALEGGNIEPVF